MSLRLVTLNIEGDKHIDRWLPVIKKLSADVVCLQELYEADCALIGEQLGMQWQYVPTVKMEQPNNYNMSLRGNWGVGMFSKLPFTDVDIEYYSQDKALGIFQEPNDPRRVILIALFSIGGQEYRVATTHFTWSAAGAITELQTDDFERLRSILKKYPQLILCGDFNAPRGRELFGMFEQLYTDHVPKEITSTIDARLHYSGKKLELVVDTVFTTSHYRVTAITVFEGVSDHKGIWADIEVLS